MVEGERNAFLRSVKSLFKVLSIQRGGGGGAEIVNRAASQSPQSRRFGHVRNRAETIELGSLTASIVLPMFGYVDIGRFNTGATSMKKTTFCIIAYCLCGFSNAADTTYSNAIKSLQPSFYYELNEVDASGGVIDSMGNAAPGSYNGDYDGGVPEAGCEGVSILNEDQDGEDVYEYYETLVPGVGEGNLAHCSNNEGHINLGPSENYGASAITVSLFFRADSQQGGDRLFTNNLQDAATSFQVNVAGEGLVVAVNPNETGEFAERTLRTVDDADWDKALVDANYGWFHVVASTSGAPDDRADNIQVWINGENRTDNLDITNWGWGVNTDEAKIGGRHDDPLQTTTHSGAQDEVAIWLDRVLTEEEVQTIWKAALGEAPAATCDFDGNGVCDADDIDALSAEIRSGTNNPTFDLTGDGLVNMEDHVQMIDVEMNTYSGDSNLDGEFSSSDFVTVFVPAKYETGQAAGWAEGDWNADGVFNSTDFVSAFAAGAYEQGPRPPAAVPEPGSVVLVMCGLFAIAVRSRR